jgi:hypothetical protein
MPDFRPGRPWLQGGVNVILTVDHYARPQKKQSQAENDRLDGFATVGPDGENIR